MGHQHSKVAINFSEKTVRGPEKVENQWMKPHVLETRSSIEDAAAQAFCDVRTL